jgi:site-specific DNA recombinase
MMKPTTIYARLASVQQNEERAISSQTRVLVEFARRNELDVREDWICEDEGYGGRSLDRAGLERVRNLAARGHIQVIIACAPDRLSRRHAHQHLLMEEFARHGVEIMFVNASRSERVR